MTDTFTPQQRSRVMSRIKGRRNLTTEIALARLFRIHRITGWRRHFPAPGKPDFAFPLSRVAVFVDGCFWHCCPQCSSIPSSNRSYWKSKLARNVERDKQADRALKAQGWTVIRLWEHELRQTERVVKGVRAALRK